MSDEQSSEIGDEIQVEVSDTDAPNSAEVADTGGHGGERTRTGGPLFAPRLSRRARTLRAGGTVGAVLLALVVVLGSAPAPRAAAGAWWAILHPTPTATTYVLYDHFYLLPNPPGTTVLLDGRVLARLPYPGDPHPLGLTRGTHTLRWLNNAFPFPPLTCRLSLPAATSDTCVVRSPFQVQPNPPANGAVVSVPVIATHLSLNALGDQGNALNTAIGSALDALTTTVTLRPSEHYLTGSGGPTDTSTKPLLVTLSMQPFPQSLAPLCDFIAPAHPCYFLGQDCGSLCTYISSSPGAPVVYNGIDPVWVAGMYVHMSMRYAAPDGTLLEQGVFSNYGIEVMLLGILWDGTNWHVLPLLGHRAPFPPSDDLVCDPAFEALGQTPISYLFYPDASFDVTLDYASGPNPSDGCLVRLAGNPRAAEPAIPGDGTALFLERLGVLLAASDAAHTLLPNLPQASAAERQLAAQLAARIV